MANLAVLTTFARPGSRGQEGERPDEGDLVVSDKLNHASLLDAARFSGAVHRTYPHGNAARARELLLRHKLGADEITRRRAFLVSDSVFSMDGDVADLPALAAAAHDGGALLVIDEAHATGVLGSTGVGLAEAQGVEPDLAVGTLSKALGSLGGFVTGPREAIDLLINAARPFIYTTALPPSCAAAALAALRIVQREPSRRHRVLALAEHVRRELNAMAFDTGTSVTPIIPVILGDSAKALAAAEFLKSQGVYVPAIRPPTVAPNSARLRISLMATHTDGQVERLLGAMRSLRKFLGGGNEKGLLG